MMMKKLILPLIGLLLISISVMAARWRAVAQDEQRYFPETGHTLSGLFLEYYQSIPHAEDLFGAPITEAFSDSFSGKLVQYFENARFEYELEAQGEASVGLTNLGSFLYKPGNPPASRATQGNCQPFSTPGGVFSVCDAFLEYFNRHGGDKLFGQPISNLEKSGPGNSDARLVQYFEKARLEWRPELPPGQRVQPGELGREHLSVLGNDPVLLAPVDHPRQTVQRLKVRAFPHPAIAPLTGEQTISVIVQDQHGQPVKDARIWFLAQLPGSSKNPGEQISFSRDYLTNEDGLASFSFPYSSQRPGLAKVQVTTQYDSLTDQTTTSFIIWY
jgi:hypothetical protein